MAFCGNKRDTFPPITVEPRFISPQYSEFVKYRFSPHEPSGLYTLTPVHPPEDRPRRPDQANDQQETHCHQYFCQDREAHGRLEIHRQVGIKRVVGGAGIVEAGQQAPGVAYPDMQIETKNAPSP